MTHKLDPQHVADYLDALGKQPADHRLAASEALESAIKTWLTMIAADGADQDSAAEDLLGIMSSFAMALNACAHDGYLCMGCVERDVSYVADNMREIAAAWTAIDEADPAPNGTGAIH